MLSHRLLSAVVGGCRRGVPRLRAINRRDPPDVTIHRRGPPDVTINGFAKRERLWDRRGMRRGLGPRQRRRPGRRRRTFHDSRCGSTINNGSRQFCDGAQQTVIRFIPLGLMDRTDVHFIRPSPRLAGETCGKQVSFQVAPTCTQRLVPQCRRIQARCRS